MTYLLKSKPKKRFSGKILLSLLFFIILWFFLYFAPFGFKNFLYSLGSPIWKTREVLVKPISFFASWVRPRNDLITEISFLKEEKQKSDLLKEDYEILKNQYNDLLNELGRSEKKMGKISKILSRPPYSPYDVLVLDIGLNDEIVIGDKVLLSQKIILGEISEVFTNQSKATLYSTSGRETEAVLQRTGESYRLVGQGGGNFKIEAPKDSDINWGDEFYYPGLSSYLLGKVYFIDTNVQSSFKVVYLKVPINIFSSNYVYVSGK